MSPTAPDFSKKLLNWYDAFKRPLPWRKAVGVYETLLSEVMSQQTTMAVVVPRFEQFIKEIPTLEMLAACNEDTLRRLWAGLGYYARARNLKKAAIEIVENRLGKLPTSYDEWLKIPGCGPYTAAVIASVCFKEPVACVDGNVIRVLSRIKQFAEVWQPKGQEKIKLWAQEFIDSKRPGDFNQAMMELGATICRKQKPLCELCPVSEYCLAHKNKLTEIIPPKKPRATDKKVELVALAIWNHHSDTYFVGKRSQVRFLSNTHGFLVCDRATATNLTADLQKIRKTCLEKLEQIFSHTITNHKITTEVWRLEVGDSLQEFENYLKSEKNLFLNNFKWISKSLLPDTLDTSFDKKAYTILSVKKN